MFKRGIAVSAALLAVLLVVSETPAHAQRIFTFGVGAGAEIGEGSEVTGRNLGHALGFIELKPPLLPFGARANGLILADGGDIGRVAATASAMAMLPLPVVRPYALAGWGYYGIAGDDLRDGWHAGAGVRVSRIFVEMQRHDRLDRTLLTFGITF